MNLKKYNPLSLYLRKNKSLKKTEYVNILETKTNKQTNTPNQLEVDEKSLLKNLCF